MRAGSGTYAIVAARERDLKWAAEQLLRGGDATVRWGVHEVRWTSGAVAYLVSGRLDALRGTRLDGALLVHGDPRYSLPFETYAFLPTLATGPDFKMWECYW